MESHLYFGPRTTGVTASEQILENANWGHLYASDEIQEKSEPLPISLSVVHETHEQILAGIPPQANELIILKPLKL